MAQRGFQSWKFFNFAVTDLCLKIDVCKKNVLYKFFNHLKTSVEKTLIYKLQAGQHPWSIRADRDIIQEGQGTQDYMDGKDIQAPEFFLSPHHSCLSEHIVY